MTPEPVCENVIEVRINMLMELLARHIATIECIILNKDALFVDYPIWVIASLII